MTTSFFLSARGCAGVLAALVLGAAVSGCSSQPKSTIGLIDTNRITSNWPEFINDQNQLRADAAAIQRSHASNRDKQRQAAQLNARYEQATRDLTDQVKNASDQVAHDRGLTYVFTREFVGYGGVDITSDVEKILKIDDKGTPSP
jgi:Skp family chaperone for outer membrane proteins